VSLNIGTNEGVVVYCMFNVYPTLLLVPSTLFVIIFMRVLIFVGVRRSLANFSIFSEFIFSRARVECSTTYLDPPLQIQIENVKHLSIYLALNHFLRL